MKKSKSPVTKLGALQWIARVLLLSTLAMLAAWYLILVVVSIIILIIIAWECSGTRKIFWGIGLLLLMVLPLYVFVGNFIHYGRIQVYDQDDRLVLVAFIACIAGCVGALLNIVIGWWQRKNHSLVT